jgi:hypothetical protein
MREPNPLTAQLRLLRKQRCSNAHGRLKTGKANPVAPAQTVAERGVVLARQILGPLLGEFALTQSRGLADLDQVAVGVSQVTANLGTAIDRRNRELCIPRR